MIWRILKSECWTLDASKPGDLKAIPNYSIWTKTLTPKQRKRDTEVPSTPFYITFFHVVPKLQMFWGFFLVEQQFGLNGCLFACDLLPPFVSGCPEAMHTDRYCSPLHYWRMPRAGFFVVKAKPPRFKNWWEYSWMLDGKSTQFTAYAQLPLHSPRGSIRRGFYQG